jgi:hypothetical protein
MPAVCGVGQRIGVENPIHPNTTGWWSPIERNVERFWINLVYNIKLTFCVYNIDLTFCVSYRRSVTRGKTASVVVMWWKETRGANLILERGIPRLYGAIHDTEHAVLQYQVGNENGVFYERGPTKGKWKSSTANFQEFMTTTIFWRLYDHYYLRLDDSTTEP